MSLTQQQMLAASGYAPPAAKKPGLLGTIAHDVASVTNISGQHAHVMPAILNAMGSQLRGVQHLYRAGHLISEENARNPQAGITDFGNVSQTRQAIKQSGPFTSEFQDLLDPHVWATAHLGPERSQPACP